MSDIVKEKIKEIIGLHNKSDITIIGINLMNYSIEHAQVFSYKSFNKALKKSYEILKEKKCECVQDEYQAIIKGHAICIRENGITKAIVINSNDPFDATHLKPGITFLLKHLTESKKKIAVA